MMETVKYCDECDNLAEWIEIMPAFACWDRRYKCDAHKPKAKPFEERFSVYLGNKAIGLPHD